MIIQTGMRTDIPAFYCKQRERQIKGMVRVPAC